MNTHNRTVWIVVGGVIVIAIIAIVGWTFRAQLFQSMQEGQQKEMTVTQSQGPLLLKISDIQPTSFTAVMQSRPQALGDQYQDHRTVSVVTNDATVYIHLVTAGGEIRSEEPGSRADIQKGYFIVTDPTSVDVGSTSISPAVIRYASEQIYK